MFNFSFSGGKIPDLSQRTSAISLVRKYDTDIITRLLFGLSKKGRVKENMEKSLQNLTELVRRIGDAVRLKAGPVDQ